MAKAVLVALLALACCNCFAGEGEWEDVSGGNTGFTAVFAHPGTDVILATTAQGSVISSADSGKQWRTVYFFEHSAGEPACRPCFAFDPAGKRIYLAAGRSVYMSADTGNSWERALKRPDNCNAVEATPAGIYLAADSGMFLSKDGKKWDRVKEIAARNIMALAYSPAAKVLFCATDDGIYAMRPDCGAWQKIFAGMRGPDVTQAIEQQEESSGCEVRLLRVDKSGTLYAVFGNRFMSSADNGKTWKNVSSAGLRVSKLADISCAGHGLIVASGSDVLSLENDSWNNAAEGLTAGALTMLSLDGKGTVFAAGKRGLFRLAQAAAGQETAQMTASRGQSPSVRLLQQAAIAYAEVDNEKIKQWRCACRKKAWLPQVNVGVNRDIGDLWHWESGSTTKENDDQLRKGRDALAWDLGLSWDLSELVWNNDQTSIDSRAKLMVELRNDILDQVTKLYFERERLEEELSDPAGDRAKRRQKQLRVRELEAGLDALTGGAFTNSSR